MKLVGHVDPLWKTVIGDGGTVLLLSRLTKHISVPSRPGTPTFYFLIIIITYFHKNEPELSSI